MLPIAASRIRDKRTIMFTLKSKELITIGVAAATHSHSFAYVIKRQTINLKLEPIKFYLKLAPIKSLNKKT